MTSTSIPPDDPPRDSPRERGRRGPDAAPTDGDSGSIIDLLDDDLFAQWEAEATAERERLVGRLVRHRVTAVLVSHDGSRWLPFCLTALADLELAPFRVVAVDTSHDDAPRRQLETALGAASVLHRDPDTGFAASVHTAVEALVGHPGLPTPVVDAPPEEWLWILHDDCAPEPDALRELLLAAEQHPRAAVVGPKIRGWRDGRQLLECGISIGHDGHRATGLERGEVDQGQHDDRRETLAVGSAGMLVRRDAWDRLGGFDARYLLFREDVDLCWRAWAAGYEVVVAPSAVVHHASAAATGRRPADAVGGHRRRADRAGALRTLLGNAPVRRLPWVWLRLVGNSLIRMIALLLAKAPGQSWDELVAAGSVLLRPDRISAARRSRQPQAGAGWAVVKPLVAPSSRPIRHGAEWLVGTVVGREPEGAHLIDPTSDENMGTARPHRLRRALSHAGLLLTLGLIAATLAAWRGMLGTGRLVGGALAAAPEGASDLWSTYASAFHPVGAGSTVVAPPSVALQAIGSVLTLGKPGWLVTLLLISSVPLAGAVAYVGAARITQSRALRAWAAVTYALLPALTGGVAAGRIGTVVLSWLLPLVALLAVRSFDRRRKRRWSATWATALALTAAAAFVPVIWAAAVLLLVLGAIPGPASRRPVVRGADGLRRALAIGLTPPVLLLPWSLELLHHPGQLLLEAGAVTPSTVDPSLASPLLLLAHPGGPGLPPWWVLLGLLLGAALAPLRGARAPQVLAAWAVVAVGLAVGLLALVLRVPAPALGTDTAPWPGPATLLLGGGLVAAGAYAADGLRERLEAQTFGWRQPLALVLAGLVAFGTAVSLWGFVARGAGDPLDRRDPSLLSPFAASTLSGSRQVRALLLTQAGAQPATTAATPSTSPSASVIASASDASASPSISVSPGAVSATASDAPASEQDAAPAPVVARTPRLVVSLLRTPYPTMGDVDVAGPADQELLDLARRLAAGSADPEVLVRLSRDYAVGTVVGEGLLAATTRELDSTAGLERLATFGGAAQWRVTAPTGRLIAYDDDGSVAAVVPATGTAQHSEADLSPNLRAGSLVLAERPDARWSATLDGLPLVASDARSGTTQAWSLPAGGGHLVVAYDEGSRRTWLLVEGALLLVVVVLALPGRREPAVEAGDDLPVAPQLTRGGVS